MASYNINIRTETHIFKSVTVEREDLTGLRVEMGRFVGAFLTDHAAQIWTDEHWQVDVTDARGLILYVIQIDAMKTSATMTR